MASNRALARISELGVHKYTFGVNWVSNFFSSYWLFYTKIWISFQHLIPPPPPPNLTGLENKQQEQNIMSKFSAFLADVFYFVLFCFWFLVRIYLFCSFLWIDIDLSGNTIGSLTYIHVDYYADILFLFCFSPNVGVRDGEASTRVSYQTSCEWPRPVASRLSFTRRYPMLWYQRDDEKQDRVFQKTVRTVPYCRERWRKSLDLWNIWKWMR